MVFAQQYADEVFICKRPGRAYTRRPYPVTPSPMASHAPSKSASSHGGGGGVGVVAPALGITGICMAAASPVATGIIAGVAFLVGSLLGGGH